jgi:polysaccharide biosynthesis transport protein
LLGILPKLSAKEMGSGVPMLDAPGSLYSEAIWKLRSTLLLSRSAVPPKVLLVGSGSAGEGKTTLTINLALALAHRGTKVLVVETDMRRPSLQHRFQMEATKGLSGLLTYRSETDAEAIMPSIAGVSVLVVGPTPPYPAELLGSLTFGQMLDRFKEHFDFIVVDTSPVLPVADAQLIAGYADAMILVARSGATTRTSLKRTYGELLPRAKNQTAPAIGVVLSGVPVTSSAYFEYYGYKLSAYHSKVDPNEIA